MDFKSALDDVGSDALSSEEAEELVAFRPLFLEDRALSQAGYLDWQAAADLAKALRRIEESTSDAERQAAWIELQTLLATPRDDLMASRCSGVLFPDSGYGVRYHRRELDLRQRATRTQFRAVRNCEGGTSGRFRFVEPTEYESANPLKVVLLIRCAGGLPITISIDEVRYALPLDASVDNGIDAGVDRGRLIRNPAHPDCPDGRPCTVQYGGSGTLRYRIRLPDRPHRLGVHPGFQGTSLPRFRSLYVQFETVSP